MLPIVEQAKENPAVVTQWFAENKPIPKDLSKLDHIIVSDFITNLLNKPLQAALDCAKDLIAAGKLDDALFDAIIARAGKDLQMVLDASKERIAAGKLDFGLGCLIRARAGADFQIGLNAAEPRLLAKSDEIVSAVATATEMAILENKQNKLAILKGNEHVRAIVSEVELSAAMSEKWKGIPSAAPEVKAGVKRETTVAEEAAKRNQDWW